MHPLQTCESFRNLIKCCLLIVLIIDCFDHWRMARGLCLFLGVYHSKEISIGFQFLVSGSDLTVDDEAVFYLILSKGYKHV